MTTKHGHPHTVWLLDAASAFNEITVLNRAGIRKSRCGGWARRIPALWSIFGRNVARSAVRRGLTHIAQGTNVDIEGSGEILRITALPTPGLRKLTFGANGLLANVDFLRVPRPYTITRDGYRRGAVALTFDDGPDPRWTPRILDILKAKGVRRPSSSLARMRLPSARCSSG